MKAIVYTRYGSPDGLTVQDLPEPVAGDDEVLIRVHAASINAWDWDLLRGRPYLSRLGAGLRFPKRTILGADIAGRVEGVGGNIDSLQAGDEVFGDISGSGWGGFAEYVSANERVLARKPASISFDQAAAIPQAAMLAFQALNKASIQPSQRVLIVGAGGGAGTFAVQMAQLRGAEVVAVDRGDKLEMLRSIGADRTIDYTREDFARMGPYDLIVDMVMQRSLFDYKRALAPGGRLIVVGGTTGRIAQTVALGPVFSRTIDKKMGLLVLRPNRKDLETIGEWVASDKVKPVIDRTYPLEELFEAFRYFGAGNAKGKVVISVISQDAQAQ